MATHSLIGRDFGNYTIVSLLGEGGMGAVFEARHRYLGDRAAIKILHGTYANNASVSQRFFQEAKAARDIGHPSIIKVFDFGQSDDGSLYLVMELLEGQSLTAVLAGGPLSEEEAARIVAAIALGLAAAHEKGVVHRDLKPDNIFVVGAEVKILDFGIAKVVSSSANTGTGALLGTPKYMAPEQARGSKGVGPQTDVYALGVILFQLVTGKLPFEGGEVAEVLMNVLMEAPLRPSAVARVSQEMEALILCCLEKNPALRPAGMMDLHTRLGRWLRPSSIPRAPRLLMSAPTLALPGKSPVTTLSGAVSERSRKKAPPRVGGRLLVVAVSAAAAIGVAAAGVVLTRSPSPPTSPAVETREEAIAAPPAKPARSEAPAAPARDAPPAAAPASPPHFVLRSDPPGAQIVIDGAPIDVTPKVLQRPFPYEVKLTLTGYKDAKEVLTGPGEATVKLVKKHSSSGAKPPQTKTGVTDADGLD